MNFTVDIYVAMYSVAPCYFFLEYTGELCIFILRRKKTKKISKYNLAEAGTNTHTNKNLKTNSKEATTPTISRHPVIHYKLTGRLDPFILKELEFTQ
jgi:hypothetical protein